MKVILFLNFLTICTFSFTQEKVQWHFTFNKETKVIEMNAEIAEGWHLYSQHVQNDIGPVPTSFLFDENSAVKFIGKVNEPSPIQKYDENFEAMLDFFEKDVIFVQRVSFKKNTTITGAVTYMACNETMCLPPVDELFTIELITE